MAHSTRSLSNTDTNKKILIDAYCWHMYLDTAHTWLCNSVLSINCHVYYAFHCFLTLLTIHNEYRYCCICADNLTSFSLFSSSLPGGLQLVIWQRFVPADVHAHFSDAADSRAGDNVRPRLLAVGLLATIWTGRLSPAAVGRGGLCFYCHHRVQHVLPHR